MELLEKYLTLKRQETDTTKQLNELKKQIKSEFAQGETMVGDIKVSRVSRIRIDLDKESVLRKLGEKGYRECEKASEYEVLTVKRV